MTITELYKVHINKKADMFELYAFKHLFQIEQLYVKNPNPDIEKLNQLHEIEKENIARCWILKNTKLTKI